MVYMVYEMDTIGVDGALEAVDGHPYCSEERQAAHQIAYPFDFGTEETIHSDGLVCETCGKPFGVAE